jgi:hypothetical protein
MESLVSVKDPPAAPPEQSEDKQPMSYAVAASHADPQLNSEAGAGPKVFTTTADFTAVFPVATKDGSLDDLEKAVCDGIEGTLPGLAVVSVGKRVSKSLVSFSVSVETEKDLKDLLSLTVWVNGRLISPVRAFHTSERPLVIRMRGLCMGLCRGQLEEEIYTQLSKAPGKIHKVQVSMHPRLSKAHVGEAVVIMGETDSTREALPPTIQLSRGSPVLLNFQGVKAACCYCRKEGHLVGKCPERPSSKTGCFECGRKGHRKADCPVLAERRTVEILKKTSGPVEIRKTKKRQAVEKPKASQKLAASTGVPETQHKEPPATAPAPTPALASALVGEGRGTESPKKDKMGASEPEEGSQPGGLEWTSVSPRRRTTKRSRLAEAPKGSPAPQPLVLPSEAEEAVAMATMEVTEGRGVLEAPEATETKEIQKLKTQDPREVQDQDAENGKVGGAEDSEARVARPGARRFERLGAAQGEGGGLAEMDTT